ncbi:MAG: hypothetical protein INQ03_25540 [Candidatus Heimdallarchaeota archaeon]|nr:hypothetical protein [Candidatus Heimdallarchaeota archaeon]
MSSLLSGFKRVIGALAKEGDEESKKQFIYFWDDIYKEDDEIIEVEKTRSIKDVLVENALLLMTIMVMIFAFLPVALAFNNQITYAFILTGILQISILATYFVHHNMYQQPLDLLKKKSIRFRDLTFITDDEFSFGVSDNPIVENFNQFRKDMNSTLKEIDHYMRGVNYQLTVIENKFMKTSSSLGQANYEFDRSMGNVGNYQELKGYIGLTSKGVDNLTAAFDDAISEIYDVVRLLKSLSSQTQMLALNAGIEAARAGKSGSGFEVVASNLRRLSQHVSNSAVNVKTHISAIGDHAKTSLELITESMQRLSGQLDGLHRTDQLVQNEMNTATRDFNAVQSNYDELLKQLQKIELELKKFRV